MNLSMTTKDTNSSVRMYSEESWMILDNIVFEIETYYLWAILALGFPGNCFTIITIVKMSPVRSLTIYIALLAVVDNAAIVIKILMFYLTDQGVQIGLFGCKILGFFGNFLITYGNWILVGFSVERFAAVWFPFTIERIWTFKKTLVVVASITFPLVALFLHLFWTMDYLYVEDTKSVFCKINENYLYFMLHVWYWINVVIYAALPCLLLLIFNILIIIGMNRSTKIRRFLNRNDSKRLSGNTAAERQRQITVMLVTSAIVLVVLTTPRCVLLIMSPYHNPSSRSMEGATLYLIDTIAYIFCDSTHAINFFLYSFSARHFRSHFVELIMCRRSPYSVTSQNATLSHRLSSRRSTSERSSFLKK